MESIQQDQAGSERETDLRLIRGSVREFLSKNWPAHTAVEDAASGAKIATLWREMVKQGLMSLGAHNSEAGLRETLVVFEELGFAACPAPLLGSVVVNLAISGRATDAVHTVLNDLQRGTMRISVGLGTYDGDLAAGSANLNRDNSITGEVSFVEGVPEATHVVLCTKQPPGLALIVADAPGLINSITPGMAVPPLTELVLDRVPAIHFALSVDTLIDIAHVTRLVTASRALGAAQRAFDLAVEHSKVRKQFGRYIGQFQALQHKFANCLINIHGSRLALESAAEAFDENSRDWRICFEAAVAFANPALRSASIETQCGLGAIGFAEEHEAPRHFRRVHADLARFGGNARARAQLADFLLGPMHEDSHGNAAPR